MLGRDELFGNGNFFLLFNAGMCGVLISILKYPRQVTQTKGKVKTFLFCFFFFGQERKEGVQALDIRESPLSAPSPPPLR